MVDGIEKGTKKWEAVLKLLLSWGNSILLA